MMTKARNPTEIKITKSEIPAKVIAPKLEHPKNKRKHRSKGLADMITDILDGFACAKQHGEMSLLAFVLRKTHARVAYCYCGNNHHAMIDI